MFGDFLQRDDRKCIVSKLFLDVITSVWSVKGQFQKAVLFSRRYIHFSDRSKVLKILLSLLLTHSKLCVLLFVIQVNEVVAILPLSYLLFIVIFYNSQVCTLLLSFLLLSCSLQLYVSMLLSCTTEARGFFLSPKRPDQHWGPLSLLLNVYLGSFSASKATRLCN